MKANKNAPGWQTKGAQVTEPRVHSTGSTGARRHDDAWRSRLPDPVAYYRAYLETLTRPNGSGWAQARCPFHDDHEASLSVNLLHGGWRCFAGCGRGDLLAFHQHLTGLAFCAAVTDLTGVQP